MPKILIADDEETENIPGLVITTAVGESKMEATNAGIDDFVNKPFDSEEVSIRVKSMLKMAGLKNEFQRLYVYVNELEE